jgi:hypothetical protein
MRHIAFWGALLVAFTAAAFEPSLRVTPDGIVSQGIKALDGADGSIVFDTRAGERCLTGKPDSTPPAAYLYFDIDNAMGAAIKGPAYLIVEYFDGTPGGVITVNYDSATGDSITAKYQPNEDQWGGWLVGSQKWRKGIFLLEKPGFANRENLGADFRLGGAALFVRSLMLTQTPPSDRDQLAKIETAHLKQLVKIGDGGQLIVGGFDPERKEDVRQMTRSLRAAAPVLKSMGVTSHEGYVRWNLCELEPGKFDWSAYDAFVDVYKEHGLEWVPFLIVGSPYSLPDWYYKKPESQGYVCLEHGQESDVQSLWNPALREHVARFIKAFCDHYRDTGVIESILLGPTGNYGEAIYPATGSDWTANIHGNYHAHSGFWAGDKYAVADFRKWVQTKYNTIDAMNAAWGTHHPDFDAVAPFLRDAAPNDRAWLDFCHWYIGAMSDWSTFWLGETRRNFPGDIYLCTGGHAPAEHGADFGDQCRLSAALGCGVRITNESSDYSGNFSLTRWVASAGRQYGAYFSFEPAGEVNPQGVIGRVYNATASGARGLHYYYPNLLGTDAARESFIKWGSQFKQRTPVVEIAVYYPEIHILLNGNKFLERVQPLRDRFDFDYVSDGQILDGGLKNKKALVFLWGNVMEKTVFDKVIEWARQGHLVLFADSLGTLRTVEGDESIHAALFGNDPGKGRAAVFNGAAFSPNYRAFLAKELAGAKELSRATRAMVAADGAEDNVFVSLVKPGKLLWLNFSKDTAIKNRHYLKPWSIEETFTR